MFYVDVFWLVHFFFEYILLKIVQVFLRNTSGRPRRLAAAALGSGFDVLLPLCPVPYGIQCLLLYGLVPLLEVRICFCPRSAPQYARALLVLYMTALCMGGFLNWLYERIPFFQRHGLHLMTLLIAAYFLCACFRKAAQLLRGERLTEACIREVELTVNGKRICCRGLLDTGNSLYDPISKKPVLILEREELVKHGIRLREQQYRVIPYHSIGEKRGFLEGFLADEVCFTKDSGQEEKPVIKRQNVVVGVYDGRLSKDGAYQMILHPMI